MLLTFSEICNPSIKLTYFTDVMRYFSLIIIAIVASLAASAQGFVELNGKSYQVDTISQRVIGPGVKHTIVRVPGYPLNAYVLEADLTNQYNNVETNQGYNRLGKTELLSNAYNRHRAQGKKPLAGCNGAFWCVSANIPFNNWMLGVPFGGEVVNDTIYLNTNTVADAWNGGPSRSCATIIDTDKRVHIGPHQWTGFAKSAKFSADQEIIQVNKRVDTGQLALFNHAIGRDHKFYTVADCNYVYLNLKEGERWRTAEDITFVVQEVKTDANDQVLGNYDACLVGDGAYKGELAKLAPGDEVTVNYYWFALMEDDKSPIKVANSSEGNAWVMLHGELTYRNTDETYNTQTYSKCAYGTNAEGNKLYMLVIDMSTHPVYGKSAGCSTTVCCQLFKFLIPELWNVSNNDAGGSAQMMVGGTVINKTTEVTPRAVANGMLLFSTAPDEEADVITSLRFDDFKITTPIYFTITPRVLGYNKYGELIDDDVQGVTFTCSDNVGAPRADGGAIEVGGNNAYGTITAHLGDIEVTAPITVVNSEFSIRIKPMILLDVYREYPIEISTVIGQNTLQYDPNRFTWTIDDPTVCEINNGVLHGLKEGLTTITASLGAFSESTQVKVEVAADETIEQPWIDWSVTSANLSEDATLAADGTISYGFAGKRRADITIAKDVTFYSLPDSVVLDFNTSTRLSYLKIEYLTPQMAEPLVKQINIEVMEAGHHRIDLLDYLDDRTDLINFPISVKSISYGPHASGYVAGANTITQRLYSAYEHHSSGVGTVERADSRISLYSAANGAVMVCAAGIDEVAVDIYSIAGACIASRRIAIAGGTAAVDAQLPAGVYIVKAQGGGETTAAKLVVR